MHISVLLQEVVDGLEITPGNVFLDGTLGGGGHSAEIAKRFGDKVRIVGLDRDADAILRSEKIIAPLTSNVQFIQKNFRNMDEALQEAGVKKVDRILLDLGLSSNQFEESERGFTFQKDEPLLMTFCKTPEPDELTAFKVINDWDEENIAQIIESYGEERYAKKIAHAIIFARRTKKISKTSELVEIIKSALPNKELHKKIHPATKTFQAIRITVNDEIGALKEGLEKGFNLLNKNGRMAIISFHSIEDRIVKNFFREKSKNKLAELINKKPLTASTEELNRNPRSRSAKLRIIRKI